MIRTLLEHLFRYVTFVRRLPKSVGGNKIWVSPGAGLRFLAPGLEKADALLFKITKECIKKGDVVWDVGANVGLFAFSAAYYAGSKGRVVALEADEWLVSLLRKSCLVQGMDVAPVDVLSVAIAKEVGVRTFCIAKRSRATNHLSQYGSNQTGGVKDKQLVVSVSLDWLLNFSPAPDFLKIDVEGAECEVLEGAKDVFSRKRPIVLIEVFGEHSEVVTEFLKDRNYALYDADQYPENKIELEKAIWNTLAIPKNE